MDKAARQGVPGAEELFSLTPREFSARLACHRAHQSFADRTAWMAARYMMLSVHCPDRLPMSPVFFPLEREAMTADEIKAHMRRMKGDVPFDA